MARDLGLTFAGGGNRAFYHLGVMERLWERLEHRVAGVAGTSAGACAAVMIVAGRADQAREFFARRRRGVTRLVRPEALLRGDRLTPHDAIYRETILHALEDGGLERIRRQPFPILVSCATYPRVLHPTVGLALAFGAQRLEARLRRAALHPSVGPRVGFRAVAFDARECETPAELTELVLASSSVPPLTRPGRFRGHDLIDGSAVDNAPAFLVERLPEVTRSLVLLTSPLPSPDLARRGMRYYVAPSDVLPVDRWDYTEHAPVEGVRELGRREAARHDALVEELLG